MNAMRALSLLFPALLCLAAWASSVAAEAGKGDEATPAASSIFPSPEAETAYRNLEMYPTITRRYGTIPADQRCRYCYGGFVRKCDACKGSGAVQCVTCNGTGRVKSKDCQACKGTGMCEVTVTSKDIQVAGPAKIVTRKVQKPCDACEGRKFLSKGCEVCRPVLVPADADPAKTPGPGKRNCPECVKCLYPRGRSQPLLFAANSCLQNLRDFVEASCGPEGRKLGSLPAPRFDAEYRENGGKPLEGGKVVPGIDPRVHFYPGFVPCARCLGSGMSGVASTDASVAADGNGAEVLQLKKSAANDDRVAMFKLGQVYEKGLLGERKSNIQAEKYYRKSAEAGHPEAMEKMGAIYENGLLDIKADKAKAREWYDRADAARLK